MMGGSGGPPGGFGGPPGGPGSAKSSTKTQSSGADQATDSSVVRKPLWYVEDNGKLAAVMVEVGVSDTLKTEVIGADALVGKKIILKVKAE
jgi:hypothetical protein